MARRLRGRRRTAAPAASRPRRRSRPARRCRIGQSPPTRGADDRAARRGGLGANPSQGRREVGGVDDAVRAARRRWRIDLDVAEVDEWAGVGVAGRDRRRAGPEARAPRRPSCPTSSSGRRAARSSRRRAQLAHQSGERGDVATIVTERVHERRGDDDPVGAGLRDRPNVGRLAHTEPDADRDR